jgi:hypothetical protein
MHSRRTEVEEEAVKKVNLNSYAQIARLVVLEFVFVGDFAFWLRAVSTYESQNAVGTPTSKNAQKEKRRHDNEREKCFFVSLNIRV